MNRIAAPRPFEGWERTIASETPSLSTELLRERTWLRRLAASLVVDAAQADDLAQQTLLTALERPPADANHPRSWLATVLRRLARDASVGARRRTERERRFAPTETQPATDEVVARAELEHRVAAAVLDLAEPYRTTVLLTFFEDLPPRDVARRMDVPVETVRTRLKRGVELVRARVVVPRVSTGDASEAPALLLLLDAPARGAVRRALLAKSVGAVAGGGAGVFVLARAATFATATKVVAAASIVVAAALGVVASRSHPARSSPAAQIGVASGPKPAAALPPEPDTVRTLRAPEVVADEPGSDAWLARYGFIVTPNVAGGLPIHVRYVDGSPAAGVAVFVIENETQSTTRLAQLARDPIALRGSAVTVYRADARGDAAIRWLPRGYQAVLALSGSLRAGRPVGLTPRPPIDLVLRHAESLRVTVVDRSGHPCGDVPVDFGYRLDATYANGAVRVATSAADGSAILPDVDIRPELPPGAATWFVAVECGVDPEDEITVDPDRPPAEPIVLTLGAAGTLELAIVDEREEPVEFNGEMELELEQKSTYHHHRRIADFRSGRAIVAPVGLGLEWTLWSTMKGRRLRGAQGSGPRADGERVLAKLHACAPGPLVAGRVVDRDGAPLHDRRIDALELEAVNAEGDGGCNGFQTQTDEDGRFEFDLHNVKLDVFRRSLLLTLGGDGREYRRAFLSMSPRLAREVVSVGDVVMEEVTPTLSGRVVDPSGRPLAGAYVQIAGEDLRVSVEERERFGTSMATSDDEGRFAIVGWPQGRYQVFVHCDGYRNRPREWKGSDEAPLLPRNDVTLTLEHEGVEFAWLLGGVLADPLFHQALRQVEVRLRPRDADAPVESAVLQDDGALNMGIRRSGLYDVVVALRNVDDPRETLATIDGIEMRAGAVTVDPRLENLDLRGRLHALSVAVLGVDGKPDAEALVHVQLGDEVSRSSRYAYAGHEPARFLTTQPVLDVEAIGPDGTRATTHSVAGDVTLRLAPVRRIVVHLKVDRPEAVRGQPVTLTAKLLPAKSGLDGTLGWLTATFDAEGAASIVLPCGGEWCVTVSARVQSRFPMIPEDVVPAPVPFTLPGDADAATISIPIDEAALAKLLQRAKDG